MHAASTHSSYQQSPYQLDHPYGRSGFFEYPSHSAMRNTAENYVFFEWPGSVDPTQYDVVIESLDTAGPTFRTIGMLGKNRTDRQSYIRLPDTHFDWHGRIGVIPRTNVNLPQFEAEIGRGSTYTIPAVQGPRTDGTAWQMRRHGAIGLGF
jgi:hypothetical protein